MLLSYDALSRVSGRPKIFYLHESWLKYTLKYFSYENQNFERLPSEELHNTNFLEVFSNRRS